MIHYIAAAGNHCDAPGFIAAYSDINRARETLRGVVGYSECGVVERLVEIMPTGTVFRLDPSIYKFQYFFISICRCEHGHVVDLDPVQA